MFCRPQPQKRSIFCVCTKETLECMLCVAVFVDFLTTPTPNHFFVNYFLCWIWYWYASLPQPPSFMSLGEFLCCIVIKASEQEEEEEEEEINCLM